MDHREVPILRNTATHKLSLVADVREIAQYSHLLSNLVQRDLTVRYKRSILGFFWTMLNPLLLMIIFTIIFATIFKFNMDNAARQSDAPYAIYFLSEYLVFMFYSQTTVTAMTSMAWHGDLMKKVRVPKLIFSISTVISGLVNLLLSYIPLLLIMLFLGAPIRPAMLFLPVAFIIIAMFTLGVSLMLSALAVYFEDISHMYGVGVLALLYLTPIIYPIEIVPMKFLWVIRINPLTQLFKLARDPVYYGTLPEPHIFFTSLAVSIITLLLGWLVFNRLSRGFYLHL